MKKIISKLKRFEASVFAFSKNHPLIFLGIVIPLLLVCFFTLCVVIGSEFSQYWDSYPDFGSCPNSCHCYFYFVMGFVLFPIFLFFNTFFSAVIATVRNLKALKKDKSGC